MVITGFEYTYDDLSRIIEEKVLANSTKMCYTYDNLSRVTARTVKKLSDNSVVSTETFNYDAAGNVTSAPDSSFQYDTNNRLISFNGNTVSYDLDGNMLSNGSLSCTYDSANRLVSAGGHTYTYNAEDVRIRNCRADADTTYVYDTNVKLSRMLMKTTNCITTKYVYGLGLIGEEKEACFKTYHFDSRGSTIAITDASGNITDTFAYDTYGKCVSHIGSSFVIFGYNGRDGVVTETNGLIYMRARYYSPEMRRFINADIIAGKISNAITLNRFAYANGNPVSYTDPFGLSVDKQNELNNKYKNKALNILNKAVSPPFAKIPILELSYELLVGDIRYYGSFEHTLGNEQIDPEKLKKLWEGQIELSKSYNFANGEFVVKIPKENQVCLSYSSQVDDYNTVTATVIIEEDSFSGECTIKTQLNEFNGKTVTSTFGIEKKLSIPPQPPLLEPVIVPEPETEKKEENFFYDPLLIGILFTIMQQQKNAEKINDFGEALAEIFGTTNPAPPLVVPFPGFLPLPIF